MAAARCAAGLIISDEQRCLARSETQHYWPTRIAAGVVEMSCARVTCEPERTRRHALQAADQRRLAVPPRKCSRAMSRRGGNLAQLQRSTCDAQGTRQKQNPKRQNDASYGIRTRVASVTGWNTNQLYERSVTFERACIAVPDYQIPDVLPRGATTAKVACRRRCAAPVRHMRTRLDHTNQYSEIGAASGRNERLLRAPNCAELPTRRSMRRSRRTRR